MSQFDTAKARIIEVKDQFNLGRSLKHEIRINSSENNGFIVMIGCANFTFGYVKTMLEFLNAYLLDPDLIRAGCSLSEEKDPRPDQQKEATRSSLFGDI